MKNLEKSQKRKKKSNESQGKGSGQKIKLNVSPDVEEYQGFKFKRMKNV